MIPTTGYPPYRSSLLFVLSLTLAATPLLAGAAQAMDRSSLGEPPTKRMRTLSPEPQPARTVGLRGLLELQNTPEISVPAPASLSPATFTARRSKLLLITHSLKELETTLHILDAYLGELGCDSLEDNSTKREALKMRLREIVRRGVAHYDSQPLAEVVARLQQMRHDFFRVVQQNFYYSADNFVKNNFYYSYDNGLKGGFVPQPDHERHFYAAWARLSAQEPANTESFSAEDSGHLARSFNKMKGKLPGPRRVTEQERGLVTYYMMMLFNRAMITKPGTSLSPEVLEGIEKDRRALARLRSLPFESPVLLSLERKVYGIVERSQFYTWAWQPPLDPVLADLRLYQEFGSFIQAAEKQLPVLFNRPEGMSPEREPSPSPEEAWESITSRLERIRLREAARLRQQEPVLPQEADRKDLATVCRDAMRMGSSGESSRPPSPAEFFLMQSLDRLLHTYSDENISQVISQVQHFSGGIARPISPNTIADDPMLPSLFAPEALPSAEALSSEGEAGGRLYRGALATALPEAHASEPLAGPSRESAPRR